MDHADQMCVDEEAALELPARLETSSFFSPVIVVAPQIAIAINAVDFGGAQAAAAVNALHGAVSLG